MKKRMICTLAIAVVAEQGLSVPTLYPSKTFNSISNIRNTTTSTVLADTLANDVFYVLPPGHVEPHVSDISLNANTGFCEEMADLQGYSRRLAARIAGIDEKIAETSEQIGAIREDVNRHRTEAANFLVTRGDLQDLLKLKDDLADLELELKDARDARIDCASQEECERAKEVYDELRGERRKLREMIREKKRVVRSDERKYERIIAKAVQAESLISSLNDDLFELNNKLLSSKNQIFLMYKMYAALEGGVGSISYVSNWNQNVEELRQHNPGYYFSKIQTSDVNIFGNLVSSDSKDAYLAGLPAILSFTINGVHHNPWDEKEDDRLPSVPESMNSAMRLSLIGACPIKDSSLFDIPRDATGLPKFSTTVMYNFGVGISAKMTMKYNLYRVYDRMEKKASRGGFFSSSASHKVREEAWDTDTLDIQWLDEGEVTSAQFIQGA